MRNDGRPPRTPHDGAIFASDMQRAHAAEIRRLLIRVENGDGDDRALGADILETTGAPMTIGSPIGCLDCVYDFVQFLEQDSFALLDRAKRILADRVRAGWKSEAQITTSDIARVMCALALKVYLGRMERAPA